MTSVDERIRKTTLLESALRRPELGSLFGLAAVVVAFMIMTGPINVGIVRDGARALLIDCGDGRVAGVLKQLGVTSIDQILFTHHHRDQACGRIRQLLFCESRRTGATSQR